MCWNKFETEGRTRTGEPQDHHMLHKEHPFPLSLQVSYWRTIYFMNHVIFTVFGLRPKHSRESRATKNINVLSLAIYRSNGTGAMVKMMVGGQEPAIYAGGDLWELCI